MTREEALKVIEGMTEEDLILFRSWILEMLHNQEVKEDDLAENQAKD